MHEILERFEGLKNIKELMNYQQKLLKDEKKKDNLINDLNDIKENSVNNNEKQDEIFVPNIVVRKDFELNKVLLGEISKY